MSDFNKPPAPDEPPATGAYGSPPPPPPGDSGTPPYAPGGYGAPPPPAPYGAPTAGAPVTEADERLWGMLGHIGGILIGFISGLVVYLIYKDRSQYLKEQGAEALNFQITMVIGYVVASVLSVIGIGFLLYPVVWILQIVFGIIAGLAANKHENYRYPFAIRFVK